MTQGNTPAKTVWRPVLMLFAALIIVPIAMIVISILTYYVSSANAQEALEQRDVAIAEAEKAEAERAESRVETVRSRQILDVKQNPQPLSASGYRPVIETGYEEQRVHGFQPEVDEKTGKTVYKPREIVQRVPVTTTRFLRTTQISLHGPKVTQLSSELRAMKEDDENREAKLEELRQRLELEFTKMHENQSNEIEKTAKRLDSLKQLHQQRGENKDKIVQRRMDELLGKADALQWNASQGTALATPREYQLRTQTPRATFTPRPITPTRQTQQTPLKPATRVGARAVYPAPPNVSNTPPTDAYQRIEPPATVRTPLQPQVNVSASSIGEVFQLARSSANAISDLAATQLEHEQFSMLRDTGVIPISELRKAELKLEKLKREVELNRFQLEALSESFARELKLAESMLEHAQAKLKLVELGFKNGVESTQRRLQAQYEADKARTTYEVAASNIRQLKKATELVELSRKTSHVDEENDDGSSSDESAEDPEPR